MPIEVKPYATVITGDSVESYRLLALAKALRFYAETGMKITRNITPTDMLRQAAQATGKAYKRGQYQQAHDDLMALFQRREGGA